MLRRRRYSFTFRVEVLMLEGKGWRNSHKSSQLDAEKSTSIETTSSKPPSRRWNIRTHHVHPGESRTSYIFQYLTKGQTKIADLVQIHPEDFNKEASQAIEDNINAKYANKVIQKIGLCICLYDLLSASEGLIGHGTGLVNVNGMPQRGRGYVIVTDAIS